MTEPVKPGSGVEALGGELGCTNAISAEPSMKQSNSSPAETTGTTSAMSAGTQAIADRDILNKLLQANKVPTRCPRCEWEIENCVCSAEVVDGVSGVEAAPTKSEYLLGFEACREQVCGYLATRIKAFRTKTIGEDVIDKVRALKPERG